MNAVVTAVTSVFTAIGNWITTTLPDVVSVFYNTETGLTFLGVLALCGLAVSIFFLLLGVIQRFLTFRA